MRNKSLCQTVPIHKREQHKSLCGSVKETQDGLLVQQELAQSVADLSKKLEEMNHIISSQLRAIQKLESQKNLLQNHLAEATNKITLLLAKELQLKLKASGKLWIL